MCGKCYYLVLLCWVLTCQLTTVRSSLHRKERAIPVLLFPPTAPTRTQWIVGIGIPVENLLFEAITTGYVFKAEYFLPETVAQLKTKNTLPLTAKLLSGNNFERNLVDRNMLYSNQTFWNLMEQEKKVLSNYRWSVYKALEGLAVRMGLNGRACVLKSICEATEVPFHQGNGMFGELLHILLTPSSSADVLSEYADNEYFHAESLGRSGAECHQIFSNCQRSLLDHFSALFRMEETISELLG